MKMFSGSDDECYQPGNNEMFKMLQNDFKRMSDKISRLEQDIEELKIEKDKLKQEVIAQDYTIWFLRRRK